MSSAQKPYKILVTVTGASDLPKLREIATIIEPTDLKRKYEGQLKRDEVMELIHDIDGLFCTPQNGRIDAELLDKAKKLKVIGTYSVGFEHIDLPECKKRGIKVGYTPNILTEAVAETGMTLLLTTARKIPSALEMARDWPAGWKEGNIFCSCGMQIEGSTIGILGYGRIGGSLVEKLVPFHPKRILYNDIVKRDGPADYATFEELLHESDVIIITVVLTDDSRGKFNKETLLKMKKDAILINISRGPIVKTMDLYEVMKSGHLQAAALDVVDPEPLPPDHPLYTLKNCYILPHIGSSTFRTREAMLRLTEDNIYNGLQGKPLPTPLE